MPIRHLWIVLIALFPTCLLQAEPVEQLYRHSYVNDFAGVLDSTSIQTIEEQAKRLEHWTGAQINVATVRSLDGEKAGSYALRLFKEWSVAPELPYHRILILLVSQEEHVTIAAGSHWREFLSTRITKFDQEMTPYLRWHQYGPALAILTKRIADAIAENQELGSLKPVEDWIPLGTWLPVAQPYEVLSTAVIFMIILCMITAIVVLKKTMQSGRATATAPSVLDLVSPSAKSNSAT